MGSFTWTPIIHISLFKEKHFMVFFISDKNPFSLLLCLYQFSSFHSLKNNNVLLGPSWEPETLCCCKRVLTTIYNWYITLQQWHYFIRMRYMAYENAHICPSHILYHKPRERYYGYNLGKRGIWNEGKMVSLYAVKIKAFFSRSVTERL